MDYAAYSSSPHCNREGGLLLVLHHVQEDEEYAAYSFDVLSPQLLAEIFAWVGVLEVSWGIPRINMLYPPDSTDSILLNI